MKISDKLVSLLVFLLFFLLKPACAQVLPENWLGNWKGEINWFRDDSTQQIPMQLAISPIDSAEALQWKIIYGNGDNADVRDYRLITINKEKGAYLLDEQNSITIRTVLKDHALYSVFHVNSSFVQVTYRLVNEGLQVTMVSFNQDQGTVSGGKGEIPEVTDYKPVVQSGILTRQ